MSRLFIDRPVATVLLMAALLLLGAVSYPLLPIAALPQVDFPTIQVTTQLPGASPDTMASSVTAPLERQFGQISGVTQITSSSTTSTSAITVQFELSRNIDGAAQDIQTAINAASGQLPTELPSPPSYRKINPADAPIMVLAVHSDLMPLTVVDDYAETALAQHISQITGVAQVGIDGQQKPAVRIELDPARVAARGLSLEALRTALGTVTSNKPTGQVDGAAHSFTIQDNGQVLHAAGWEDAIVAWRDGAPVRVRDIGYAVDGAENVRLAAWANGHSAILLTISKQPGANVIATVNAIKAALPALRATIPPGVQVEVLSDRTQTIRAAVDDVQVTLLLTVVLVVAVIFVFLRSLRATVIPAVTVPLALVATFAAMLLLGYSLDNLSLMALSIAVGFVVDDAIVVVENIHRHLEDGLTPYEAALRGAGEIGFTVLSISISLIAVFIPLFLMSGIVGRIFREFAVTVSMTILVSAGVALSLTPMLCARLLRPEREVVHGRLYNASERAFGTVQAAYERTLDVALRHHRLTFAAFLATIGATAWLFVSIPKGFFPQQDTGLIIGTTQAAPDISFSAMAERSRALVAVVQRDPDVATVSLSLGAVAGLTPNQGRVFIALKPKDQRHASAGQIIARLRPQLAQVQGAQLLMQAAQDINIGGRPSSTQYQYTLQDADAAELASWAPRIQAALRRLPQVRDVASDLQVGGTTLTVSIDRDAAARYGIQPQVIEDTLYDAFGQRQIAKLYTQTNTYHLVMEVTPEARNNPGVLQDIYVPSPVTGLQVPIASLAHWTTAPLVPLAVNHQSQYPAVTLSFNLPAGVALGDAVAAIQAAQRQLGVPGGVLGSFQGTAQAFQSSLASEPALILAALVVIYIVLGVLYESYVHPLTIISTLPSAGAGALLTLRLCGYDFSIVALIGIILLIGIVKKNGIMLVDFAVHAERTQGRSPDQAIRDACLLRFRPILMTTMAALMGGVPLMLGTGTGAEIRQPLGYAMVGGLALSQLLTLYTTPVVYLYMGRIAWGRASRVKRVSSSPMKLAAD